MNDEQAPQQPQPQAATPLPPLRAWEHFHALLSLLVRMNHRHPLLQQFIMKATKNLVVIRDDATLEEVLDLIQESHQRWAEIKKKSASGDNDDRPVQPRRERATELPEDNGERSTVSVYVDINSSGTCRFTDRRSAKFTLQIPNSFINSGEQAIRRWVRSNYGELFNIEEDGEDVEGSGIEITSNSVEYINDEIESVVLTEDYETIYDDLLAELNAGNEEEE